MYIEIHNYEEMEQDILYFKLSNALNMDRMVKMNEKLSGIYAIYKDDVCVYVGQSKNLASRLATHLRGKYSMATSIFCWTVDGEKLDNHEKYVMADLKPIENLMIDMDFSFPDDDTLDISLGYTDITIAIPRRGGKLIIADYDRGGEADSIATMVEFLNHKGDISQDNCDDILRNYNKVINLRDIPEKESVPCM